MDTVHSWLLTSIKPELCTSFLAQKTPWELWKELNTRFNQANGAMLYDTLVQMYTLYQGQDDVCTYYTKLTELWNTYDTNKENDDPPDQFERSVKFLMGLNDEYMTIRRVLVAVKPTPKHGELYLLIKQKEKQRSLTAPTEPSTTLLAITQHRSTNTQGLYRPPRPDTRERPFCTYCKRPGHTTENCYQVHGYPEKHAYGNQQSGNTQNFRKPNRFPQTQNNNIIRRNFNNKQNPRANNTYAEEPTNTQSSYDYQEYDNQYENQDMDNDYQEGNHQSESWANNANSQGNTYNLLTNEQLRMILNQNNSSNKPNHSANVGRITPEKANQNHQNDTTGRDSYCFISTAYDSST